MRYCVIIAILLLGCDHVGSLCKDFKSKTGASSYVFEQAKQQCWDIFEHGCVAEIEETGINKYETKCRQGDSK